jgi:hypothetical protein
MILLLLLLLLLLFLWWLVKNRTNIVRIEWRLGNRENLPRQLARGHRIDEGLTRICFHSYATKSK